MVTITLEYNDPKIAAAVAGAVSPDNYKIPVGLSVKTEQEDTRVVTEIVLKGKIATFVATIDDLLESVSTAEKTLHVMKKKK
jgi:hypothetical protein